MKRIMNINVFRRCLDCGYEQFELEEVKIGDDNQRTSSGFIVCPKCNGYHFALAGYRDRRKAKNYVEVLVGKYDCHIIAKAKIVVRLLIVLV